MDIDRKTTKALDTVWSALCRHDDSVPFLKPVDITQCLDYSDIVKNPMDLGTIGDKLHSYASVDEFISDVTLVFTNCFDYNPVDDPFRLAAVRMARQFEVLVAEHLPTATKPDWRHCSNIVHVLKPSEPSKRRISSKYSAYVGEAFLSDSDTVGNLSNSAENTPSDSPVTTKRRRDQSLPFDDDSLIPSSLDAFEVTEKLQSKPKKPRPRFTDRNCEFCNTNDTPMWRRGPQGKNSLCNKCGVKWRAGKELRFPDGSLLEPAPPEVLAATVASRKEQKLPKEPKPPKEPKQPKEKKPKKELNKELKPEPEFVPMTSEIVQQQEPDRYINPHIQELMQAVYERKRFLANILSTGQHLQPEHIQHVIKMIREFMPSMLEGKEEIELDFEGMHPHLVDQLYAYVSSIM